ncbi:biliverdin-producing heme oxygenase [Celeribacter persicus]|uniref:Heme oxygenase n=1 Tax=Celeribacter persicus TaxID=1651082 RepID=A0A2T5HUN9_9RHOB|nr:biliverdin-producing heme oxygenase [Celeribacter persicus]PTQ75310.1 heme oxygenase [Celeribacter persicus]
MNTQTTIPALLSDRLRAATHPTHEQLDQSIMAAKPFESVENYGRFLAVQHGIHRDVAPLYEQSDLAGLFPGLTGRCRLEAVGQDLADLGLKAPDYDEAPATASPEGLGVPEALGWLYVVEGSNLGAAFLLKYAKKMGLSEAHGARHLAEPPEGRAPYWKAFKETLNGVVLNEAEEVRAIAAAETAFARVQTLVRRHLG